MWQPQEIVPSPALSWLKQTRAHRKIVVRLSFSQVSPVWTCVFRQTMPNWLSKDQALRFNALNRTGDLSTGILDELEPCRQNDVAFYFKLVGHNVTMLERGLGRKLAPCNRLRQMLKGTKT